MKIKCAANAHGQISDDSESEHFFLVQGAHVYEQNPFHSSKQQHDELCQGFRPNQ